MLYHEVKPKAVSIILELQKLKMFSTSELCGTLADRFKPKNRFQIWWCHSRKMFIIIDILGYWFQFRGKCFFSIPLTIWKYIGVKMEIICNLFRSNQRYSNYFWLPKLYSLSFQLYRKIFFCIIKPIIIRGRLLLEIKVTKQSDNVE